MAKSAQTKDLERKETATIRLPSWNLALSLALHGALAGWLITEFWLGKPEAPRPRKQATISSELQIEQAQVEPEKLPEPEEPETEADPEAPEPRVLDDTVIPAPWHRPRESTPLGPARPQPQNHDGRRLPRPVRPAESKPAETRPPVEIRPSEPSPAPSDPGPSRPAVSRKGAKKDKDDCPCPIYPRSSLRRGEEGRVILLVDVSVEGDVIDLSLQTSSGYDALDRAAMEAVRDWHFEPAEEDGRAVRDRIRVPITFKLPR